MRTQEGSVNVSPLGSGRERSSRNQATTPAAFCHAAKASALKRRWVRAAEPDEHLVEMPATMRFRPLRSQAPGDHRAGPPSGLCRHIDTDWTNMRPQSLVRDMESD